MTAPDPERGFDINSVEDAACKPEPAQAVKKVTTASTIAGLKKKEQSNNMCIASHTGDLELIHANVSKK
jgi:hypothetical protein